MHLLQQLQHRVCADTASHIRTLWHCNYSRFFFVNLLELCQSLWICDCPSLVQSQIPNWIEVWALTLLLHKINTVVFKPFCVSWNVCLGSLFYWKTNSPKLQLSCRQHQIFPPGFHYILLHLFYLLHLQVSQGLLQRRITLGWCCHHYASPLLNLPIKPSQQQGQKT